MYGNVLDVLESHPDQFDDLPAAARAAEQFGDAELAIQQTLSLRGTRSGHAQDKDELRRELAEAVVPVAQTLSAWADEAGRLDLSDEMDIEETDVLGGAEQAAVIRCDGVLTTAREHFAALSDDYGIDETLLFDLDERIDAFADAIGSPREAQVAYSSSTATLRQHFEEADRLLKRRLDRLVRRYKGTPFFEQYQAARRLVE